MPTFDYRCPVCNQVFERLVDASCIDTQRHYPCGVIAAKLPSAPAFAVHGYSAKNGYATKEGK
jgi:putative FmdB family regulatory protein